MDWKKIIFDLEKSGLTQKEIGAAAGCSQSFISDIKAGRRGERLGHEIGSGLARLWKQRTQARRATDKAQP